ncbi:MAG: hypothetical protein PHW76_01400 [Alphaproteobacteria bacterium]|nr:hypothetical protein [Alphaproteobacteria bacterium]
MSNDDSVFGSIFMAAELSALGMIGKAGLDATHGNWITVGTDLFAAGMLAFGGVEIGMYSKCDSSPGRSLVHSFLEAACAVCGAGLAATSFFEANNAGQEFGTSVFLVGGGSAAYNAIAGLRRLKNLPKAANG